MQIEPFTNFERAGSTSRVEKGQKSIASGHVGCVLIAGGQGTRLGHDGPKGTFPILPGKTLFQLFADSVAAASRKAGHPLPVAVMTSESNHEATVAHFERLNLKVDFLCQRSLPLLGLEQTVAYGPAGNGELFAHFVSSGLWERWHESGVRYLQTVLVDNPLADPFDPEPIGLLLERGADVVIKAIEREDPLEKVGCVVRDGGRVRVVEYSELADAERLARTVNGTLRHSVANLSLFALTMEFAEFAAERTEEMPFHLSWKRVPGLEKMAQKRERFIFDVLPFAERIGALVYPRAACFAPLKNAEGESSPETVRAAIKEKFQRLA